MKISKFLFFAITLFSFSAKSQFTAQFDYVTVGCDSVYFEPDTVYSQNNYVWDFGDGFTGTGPSAGHYYANDGTYTVILTEIDSLNNWWVMDSLFVTIACDSTPVVDSCNANFYYNFITCDSVWFYPIDLVSSASYSWSFGDGSVSNDFNGLHTYNTDGTYLVTLTAVDSLNNCWNTISNWVTVFCDSIPIIDSCNVDFNFEFITCDSVWFIPSVYNPSAYYQWDMGDGNVFNWEGNGYTYAADGTYPVTLTFVDSLNNCWNSVTHWVTIACDSIPVIDSCNANFDFNFITCDSLWFYPIDFISGASYNWDFGDGESSYDYNALHTYTTDDTYLVTLTVIDSLNNCWNTVSNWVTVSCDSVPVIDSCNANFDYDFVTCDSVWFAPSMYEPTAHYVWNFGEGSSDHNPFTSHQYTHDGTFVVTLTVIDCMNNCWATFTNTLTVDCDSTLGNQSVIDENSLTVYPNPGTGVFYIELASISSIIQVYDLAGNIVLNTNCADNCDHFALDLTHLANGAYSVVVIDNGKMQSTRIIKN